MSNAKTTTKATGNAAGQVDCGDIQKPRRTAETVIECHAPTGTFAKEWVDVPDEAQQVIDEQGFLPCEGGGKPGPWCLRGVKGRPCAYASAN